MSASIAKVYNGTFSRLESREDSWNRAFHAMNAAYTEEEIVEAEVRMRNHLRQWPEDGKRDPWHGWEYTKGAVVERKEQAAIIGLTAEQFAEREELLRWTRYSGDFVADSTVLGAYREIACQLQEWLTRFPNDTLVQERLRQRIEEIDLAEQGLRLIQEVEEQSNKTSVLVTHP